MASYATLADLKARAGVLAQAWHDNSKPNNTDIERLLDQVANELDAFIGGAGFPAPVQDPVAQASLIGVNADKALLLALDATYGGDRANVSELRTSISDRVAAYDKAIEENDLPALVYLSASATGAQDGGASDFWTEDGGQDYWWSIYGSRFAPWIGDAFGLMPTQGPAFRKGQRL